MEIDSAADGNNGLVSGEAIAGAMRGRKLPYVEKTVPFSDQDRHLSVGWVVVRTNKSSVRIRKDKKHDERLEDDVWVTLASAGFDELNADRRFFIPIGDPGSRVPPKQIDVIAIDSDSVLVVECKSSEKPKYRSLQKDLNETRALQQSIRDWVNARYEDRRRVCFLYVTRNIRWSAGDRARAESNQIEILRDWQIPYYKLLADIVGPAARHQLQADLFADSPIQGLKASVPALMGTFGETRFYQFAIEPEKLLKLAYVSHRTKIDAEAIGTYQRLLKKTRLKQIAAHIDEASTNSIFPTNIVVNFRKTRGLRFDRAGPRGNSPTVLGTLHLPNVYKSAWVIDGQHRLFGFAQSQRSDKGKVPVLAFEGLDPEKEVKMFVEINNKQVKVPRSLLIQLEPELRSDEADLSQKLRNLHVELALALANDDDSPLFGRVITSDWDQDATSKTVSLPQMVTGLRSSQLVGSVRNDYVDPGPLWTGFEATKRRALATITLYLNLFATGAEDHWERGRNEGGFLCTNLGFNALLRLLKGILDFQNHANQGIDYQQFTPDEIVNSLAKYVPPIIDWFNLRFDSENSRFRGRFGSGAPKIYALDMMALIHNKYGDFDTAELQEHIRAGGAERVADAIRLVGEIEDCIRAVTLSVLKGEFGGDGDRWWREGVPGPIRVSAASRAEVSADGGKREVFISLIEYKKIAEQPKLWRKFQPLWTMDADLRSKAERLHWMDTLNGVRNKVVHSGRRHIADEEISFLWDVWEFVDRVSTSLENSKS